MFPFNRRDQEPTSTPHQRAALHLPPHDWVVARIADVTDEIPHHDGEDLDGDILADMAVELLSNIQSGVSIGPVRR